MTVLAFLTDPEVVKKILAHLKLPICPPALVRARSTGAPLGFQLGEEGSLFPTPGWGEGEDSGTAGSSGRSPPVRDGVAD